MRHSGRNRTENKVLSHNRAYIWAIIAVATTIRIRTHLQHRCVSEIDVRISFILIALKVGVGSLTDVNVGSWC